MKTRRFVGVAFILAAAFCANAPAFAQADAPAITLTVAAGRPLRVALDQTVRIKKAGQPVTGTLVEPVYAYDRVVLPAGAPVRGHVARLIDAPRATRFRAALNGDLSVPRQVVLEFDSVVLDGQPMAIRTAVSRGTERVRRQVAGGAEASADGGVAARARNAVTGRIREAVATVKQRKSEALSAIHEPGKLNRLKEALLNRLPYHPQYLHVGTVYNAELLAPIALGTVVPAMSAPAGAAPAPDSILKARLSTTLNSADAARGTLVTAVLTEPVFSSDHELILAEGAILEGEVTFAAPARRWHRNGRLRFLFERVRPSSDQAAEQMLASLYSVDAGANDRVAVDEEGGTKVANSKTRFVAPALAVMALNGSIDQHRRRFDNDGDPYDLGQVPATTSGHWGSRGLGGFFGFGLIGAGLGQISRPVAIALATAGAARTIYKNIVGRGDDVSFQADTPIQVRLAPGKSPDR